MEHQATLNDIQKAVWDGRLPLQITLSPSESRSYDKTDPYLVFSYPPLLLNANTNPMADLVPPNIISPIATTKAARILLILID